jgi:hypothetical protein
LDRKPGQFAQERFRARRRAWLRRVWWAFVLAALVEAAIGVGLSLLVPGHTELYLGVTIGAIAGMLLALGDSPPHHIASWRRGAEGEKATAMALRPLTRRGWTLLHDLDTGYGNLDHVLVGPAGVFVLESKNLNGIVSVRHGVLSVR